MNDLVNLVQSVDLALLKEYCGVTHNIKPLLNFVADKTNKKRVRKGAFWSAKKIAKILGMSERKYYRYREQAVNAGLLIVERCPIEGERDKPSALHLTQELFRSVDYELYGTLAVTDKDDMSAGTKMKSVLALLRRYGTMNMSDELPLNCKDNDHWSNGVHSHDGVTPSDECTNTTNGVHS